MNMEINDKVFRSIAKLLNYSMKDINWKYDGLTAREKSLVTKTEFRRLKSLFMEK
jgi:hypothetical protein